MNLRRLCARLALIVTVVGAATGAARAQGVDQFYAGKTLTLVIPNAPGGSFDLYGRLAAAHLGHFIPGHPTIVAQNMPGASGVIAANWLYNVAPKDGSAMGILVPNIALGQVIGVQGIAYDVHKYNWIGRLVSPTATLFTWHTSVTKSIADLTTHETIIASTGPVSQAEITSRMMNGVVDTKFRIIEGYKGTTDASLAFERGEVEAMVMPWTFMKLAHSDWLAQKKVNVIAQYTRRAEGDLAAVPSIFELAKTADQRGVFNLFFGPDEIGQPLVLPPGAPAERVAAVRDAFAAMIKDKDYLADAARQKLALTPALHDALERTVAEAFDATPQQIEIARKYYH